MPRALLNYLPTLRYT